MRLFTASLIVWLLAGTLYAQRDLPTTASRAWQTKTHTLTGQAGIGWYSLAQDLNISNTNEDSGESYDVRLAASPAVTLAYDYRVGRSFSIGGAYGFQTNLLTNFHRVDEGFQRERVDGNARVSRYFVSARTLWHYGRTRNFEFYSGLRVGATFYNSNTTGDVDIDDISFSTIGSASVLPHLTVIPFGFKGYLNDNLFVGAETMFGSPHFAALQVGYRF